MNTITPKGDGVVRIDRIYFEPVDPKGSLALLQSRFSAASIFNGAGLWQGQQEKLTVYEMHTDVDPLVIDAFAEELRALNRQQSVRIVSLDRGELKVRDINSPI